GRSLVEGADGVGHGRVGRDDAKRQAVRLEEARDVSGGQRRVAGRVGALRADEIAQKPDDHLAVVVDPLGELGLGVAHGVGASRLEWGREYTECAPRGPTILRYSRRRAVGRPRERPAGNSYAPGATPP